MPPPIHFAIALILSAALLHALWNAVVKGSGDRGITIGLVAIGNAMFGMGLRLFDATSEHRKLDFHRADNCDSRVLFRVSDPCLPSG